MHLGPLRMQLRAAISFFRLFGTNSSPEKVQHFLVSPNSIKITPNVLFFGAATGSEVPLCWGRCTKISSFFRDPPHPSENGNMHLIDRIADFLDNKLFFLIAPRDLHFLVRDPPHPSENGNIHLIDRIGDFLRNKLFFLIAAGDLHFLVPLGSIFSAPEHVQHLF